MKLGDFGIAHAQDRESKTQAGTLKGKYGYMSPEQVTGAGLDGRSDLFAIGIVLAEMLMGRRLYTAAADLDVLLMVRDARTERLDKYAVGLAPKLDKIVRHALKKDPAERQQSAAQLREDLADFLFESGQRVSAAVLRAFVTQVFDGGPAAAAPEPAQPRAAVSPAPPVGAPPPIPAQAKRPPMPPPPPCRRARWRRPIHVPSSCAPRRARRRRPW